LQRETAPPELADDGDRNEFFPCVDTAMPLAAGRDNASFVPPLQLPRRDSRQRDYVVGCELSLHLMLLLFETKNSTNV
jgi:hypothetical protein